MLGRLLAQEHPVDADIVVPVPDSGVPAAVGYALESKIPFRMGLIRNHYIDRKSTRLNSSHGYISYAVFCLKKKKRPALHSALQSRLHIASDSSARTAR